MSSIQVETRDGVTSFRPGDEVEGTVRWRLDQPPQTIELRLFWYTEGKGDQDVGVVETIPLADPGVEDRRPFRFRLPLGPYSFSGKLISLLWAVEAVAEPGDTAGRLEITVSPTGREIVLPSQGDPQGQ
jgi:hypothetical protein